MEIPVIRNVLEANEKLSARLKEHFARHGILTKIALLSLPEGDDKPEKYPFLFNRASAMILNKIDLLPYLDFDMETAARHARHLNAALPVFKISCRTGDGLEEWYDWLRQAVRAKRSAPNE